MICTCAKCQTVACRQGMFFFCSLKSPSCDRICYFLSNTRLYLIFFPIIMPMNPHLSLVQIFVILVTLAAVFCFPQVDLGLEQGVGGNQLATGDFYVSNTDAPPPFLPDIFQHFEIQKFLQWIHLPQPPKCDNDLSAFCCNWPAPNPNIDIQRPLHVDPKEVKKRRRKCGICKYLSCRLDKNEAIPLI